MSKRAGGHTAPKVAWGSSNPPASSSGDDEVLRATMEPMERIAPLVLEKRIPETTFGVTFAHGQAGKNANVASLTDLADLDVVRAILARESYLERLYSLVKTISKKVKPEFADVLELVRASTLDVVGAIVKWREAKGSHRVQYLWNGINYLLRISSDLDYLSDYRALRMHMSHLSLQRNPFTVVFPMEDSAKRYLARTVEQKIVEESKLIIPGSRYKHETAVGGITFATLKAAYGMEFKGKLQVGNTVKVQSMTDIPLANINALAGAKKVTLAVVDETLLPGGAAMSPARAPQGPTAGPGAVSTSARPVSRDSRPTTRDDYMSKIRQAELVLLKEEERHGKFARDPEGRLVPLITALTRRMVLEMTKDDKRPMLQKGTTSERYAPFAVASGVGLLSEAEVAEIDEKRRAEMMAKNKVKDPDFFDYDAVDNDILRPFDTTANPRNRGQDKVGGMLSSLEVKGPESRARKPIRPNITGDMEFARYRKKLDYAAQLEEIGRKRQALATEKEQLEAEREALAAAVAAGLPLLAAAATPAASPDEQRRLARKAHRTGRQSLSPDSLLGVGQRDTASDFHPASLLAPPLDLSAVVAAAEEPPSASAAGSGGAGVRSLRRQAGADPGTGAGVAAGDVGVASPGVAEVKEDGRSASASATPSRPPSRPLSARSTASGISSTGRASGKRKRPGTAEAPAEAREETAAERRNREDDAALAAEEAAVREKLRHVCRHDGEIHDMKNYERKVARLDRAREMERKRRMLSKVRLWPAWKCSPWPCRPSHPGTPTVPSCPRCVLPAWKCIPYMDISLISPLSPHSLPPLPARRQTHRAAAPGTRELLRFLRDEDPSHDPRLLLPLLAVLPQSGLRPFVHPGKGEWCHAHGARVRGALRCPRLDATSCVASRRTNPSCLHRPSHLNHSRPRPHPHPHPRPRPRPRPHPPPHTHPHPPPHPPLSYRSNAWSAGGRRGAGCAPCGSASSPPRRSNGSGEDTATGWRPWTPVAHPHPGRPTPPSPACCDRLVADAAEEVRRAFAPPGRRLPGPVQAPQPPPSSPLFRLGAACRLCPAWTRRVSPHPGTPPPLPP